MNILSIFYKDKKGGFTKRLYRLYEELALQGDEVHFLGTEHIQAEHERIFQHIFGTWPGKTEGPFFWTSFISTSLFRSLYIAKKYKVDRLVTFGPFYTALCILPVVLLKIPSVTFIRADNMLHSANRIRNVFFFLADWLGIILSTRVVFVSNTLRDVYVQRYGIPSHKVVVIPNNIEPSITQNILEGRQIRRSLGVEDDEFLISTLGVFNEDKNFAFLINVMQNLVPSRIKLLIIGNEVVPNGERQRLEQMVLDMGLAEHIIFTGWKDDPRPLISNSDLFIFPSRHEGSPNALLEALGCGIPCLGSDINEIKEVLSYEELLFPLHDKQELIEKVLRLREDPGFYNLVTGLSNERCSRFSFDWGQCVFLVIQSAS
jgi:glycosyltransferase involved in cell wall biosynthesis